MANKIKYGLKNVHYAMATIDQQTGAATYASPKRMPGGVSIAFEPSGESNSFYADNIAYATFGANAGYEGDLELAMIQDDFRVECLEKLLMKIQEFSLRQQMQLQRYLLYCSRLKAMIVQQDMCSTTVQHQEQMLKLRQLKRISKLLQRR